MTKEKQEGMSSAKSSVVPFRKKAKEEKLKTVGFGVPDVYYPHKFSLEIPSGKKNSDIIELIENFGLEGDKKEPRKVKRAKISRGLWNEVKSQVQFYLNSRLKSRGLKVGKFSAGENQIDRLLGREVCLLFWCIEHLEESRHEASAIYDNWNSYKPEEMWWLYQQIAREQSMSPDSQTTGWRVAVKTAFQIPSSTEAAKGTPAKKPVRGKRKAQQKEDPTMDLLSQLTSLSPNQNTQSDFI